MALGGGTFLVQNKVLPGAYINFISVAYASATLSDRGYATIPLPMEWGPEGEVFTVELGDFLKNSQKIFGFAYTADELKPMREIFCHAKTVHFYRLNMGGVKAENEFATAKYPGNRGNDVRIVVEANEDSTDEAPLYDVGTYLKTVQVDYQEGIKTAADLADNDFVVWKKDAVLSLTATTPLSGGETGEVEDVAYQMYLDEMERYTYNAMGCLSNDPIIKRLFAAYNERMRDEVGKKCQVVLFNHLADYEGVISVKNGLEGLPDDPSLVAWATGVAAGTAVNKSATNMDYDG